jgi:hypothetical protein
MFSLAPAALASSASVWVIGAARLHRRYTKVTCQIVDLGEVKQPFPPATQVCELLLQYLRPGVAQRLLGADCLERCDRGVQVVRVEELPKPSVWLARDRVGVDHWLAVVQVRRARHEVTRPAAKADTPASAIGLHHHRRPAR